MIIAVSFALIGLLLFHAQVSAVQISRFYRSLRICWFVMPRQHQSWMEKPKVKFNPQHKCSN